jgi:hypothetical protein
VSTTIIIILILAALALILGVILASREGGPRVTEITRTTEREEDGE